MSIKYTITNNLSPTEKAYGVENDRLPKADRVRIYNAGALTGANATLLKNNSFRMPIMETNLQVTIKAGESADVYADTQKQIDYFNEVLAQFSFLSYTTDDTDTYEITYWALDSHKSPSVATKLTTMSPALGTYGVANTCLVSTYNDIAKLTEEHDTDHFYIVADGVTAENYSEYYIKDGNEFVHPQSYSAEATYYDIATVDPKKFAVMRGTLTETQIKSGTIPADAYVSKSDDQIADPLTYTVPVADKETVGSVTVLFSFSME